MESATESKSRSSFKRKAKGNKRPWSFSLNRSYGSRHNLFYSLVLSRKADEKQTGVNDFGVNDRRQTGIRGFWSRGEEEGKARTWKSFRFPVLESNAEATLVSGSPSRRKPSTYRILTCFSSQ